MDTQYQLESVDNWQRNLFSLTDPVLKAAFRGTVDREAYAVMTKALRGEVVPADPIIVNHSMGRKLLDFIWISLEPVVHERVIETLDSAGITGWATYGVQVYDRGGRAIPGYQGFAITGRCGSMYLNKEHSEVIYEDLPGGRFPSYKGLYVAADSWDGSDVFVAADGKTAHMVVTRRVAELFRRKKITNVAFESVSEVQVSASDQPRFPRKRDTWLNNRSNVFEERPLDASTQKEVRVLINAGAELVRSWPDLDPLTVVEQIAEYVAAVRPLGGDELIDRALELGCLWAQQIVSVAGWRWAELHSEDKTVQYAIVSSDGSLAILPGLRFRFLLEDEDRPDNSILLFNMVHTGKLPQSKPGAYLLLS